MDAKFELKLKVEKAIEKFDKEREAIKQQYNKDLKESLKVIQSLNLVNDKLKRDINDKDRL